MPFPSLGILILALPQPDKENRQEQRRASSNSVSRHVNKFPSPFSWSRETRERIGHIAYWRGDGSLE